MNYTNTFSSISKNIYTKVGLFLVFCSAFNSIVKAQTAISLSGGTPDASAMLDVQSTDKGFLVPRVALTQTTLSAPITSPLTSLLVYNTSAVNDVTPGYYYWNGTTWQRLVNGNGTFPTGTGVATRAAFWSGATTLSSDADFYWDNNNKRLGVGTTSPGYKLHVYGPSGNYPAYVGSPDGYLVFGPANTSWSHFSTDRARFYFNTGGTFDTGNIGSYDEDLSLQTSGTTRVSILNSNGNVGVGIAAPGARLHVTGGGQIIGTNGTSSNTRTLTILEDGDAQTNFGSYPGAWSSALQIQGNDPARYIWLSPISTGGNARLVSIGSDFEILPGNVLASTFSSSGDVTTARYHFAQYVNTSDNSVGSGVTGVMIKAGDNYLRTGTAAAVATFLGTSLAGNYIQNQNASAQAANFWVSGSGRFNGNITSVGDIFADQNYGMGLVGVYSSTVYQNVFAMGAAYRLPANGSTTGNLYGLAWSHPNAGGVAGNLNTHGLLVLENGGWLASVSGSIRARDDMRAPIFYDQNNTAFYVDPNVNALLNKLRVDQNGTTGGQWGHDPYGYGWGAPAGSFRNLEVSSSGNYSNEPAMFRIHQWGSGSAEFWKPQGTTMYLRETPGGGGGWFTMFETQANARVTGNFYAPIMYDNNDNGYYVDPNGTSNMNQTTTDTRSRWGEPRTWTNRAAITGDQNYWTGTDGWATNEGNWDNAWKYGFSGVDIWGSNTGHPQGSGYVHAQGIVSGLHYASSDGGSAYGWMMVGAADATANRYWLRGKWGGGTSGWVEMVTSGNYTSYGDNLGNHSATTTLSMNGNLVSAAGKITFSGVGGNSGQGNDSYAIYQEGGGWGYPYPDLCIGYHTGIKIGAYWNYGGTRFYNNADFATQIFSVGDGDNYTRVGSNGMSDAIVLGQFHGDNSNSIQTFIDGQWANRASYAGGCCNPLYIQPDVGYVYIGHNWSWGTTYSYSCGWWNYSSCSGNSPTVKFQVNGGAYSYGWYTWSDGRHKKNVGTIDNALSMVSRMRGVTYDWKTMGTAEEVVKNADPEYTPLEDVKAMGIRSSVGFIAQELQQILPAAVVETEDKDSTGNVIGTHLNVNYDVVVPVLVEAIKELKKEIEELKATMAINTNSTPVQQVVYTPPTGATTMSVGKIKNDNLSVKEAVKLLEDNLKFMTKEHQEQMKDFINEIKPMDKLTADQLAKVLEFRNNVLEFQKNK